MEKRPNLKGLSEAQKDELIYSLWDQVQLLRQQVRELQAQLASNSRNSSKPPSSDGYGKPKPKSRRRKGEKSSGGQPGHKGITLKKVSQADVFVTHEVRQCSFCGQDLSKESPTAYEARQVFELREIELEVIEHQAQIKVCPYCQHQGKASFPEGVEQPAQYGARVQSLVTYLSQYQLIPYQRMQELLQDVFHIAMSQGTIDNLLSRCAAQLHEFGEAVKGQLIQSEVVHFDESGLRVDKALHWLHIASTERLTYYRIHRKRGHEAMDEIGILPDYEGCAMHDHWKSYYNYDCSHGLCNAHHLRELIYAEEEYDQRWAAKLADCLVEAKAEVDRAKSQGERSLSAQRVAYYDRRYGRILLQGYGQLPQLKSHHKRGRPKQHKIKNLFDRLKKHKWETLGFIYDFSIPFDNNQAERDVRMIKTKQKISGCFRSTKGADRFALIRSYISTTRKQGLNLLDALSCAFNGNAFIPVSRSLA